VLTQSRWWPSTHAQVSLAKGFTWMPTRTRMTHVLCCYLLCLPLIVPKQVIGPQGRDSWIYSLKLRLSRWKYTAVQNCCVVKLFLLIYHARGNDYMSTKLICMKQQSEYLSPWHERDFQSVVCSSSLQSQPIDYTVVTIMLVVLLVNTKTGDPL